MSHLIWIYTVCPRVSEFSVWYGLDEFYFWFCGCEFCSLLFQIRHLLNWNYSSMPDKICRSFSSHCKILPYTLYPALGLNLKKINKIPVGNMKNKFWYFIDLIGHIYVSRHWFYCSTDEQVPSLTNTLFKMKDKKGLQEEKTFFTRRKKLSGVWSLERNNLSSIISIWHHKKSQQASWCQIVTLGTDFFCPIS